MAVFLFHQLKYERPRTQVTAYSSREQRKEFKGTSELEIENGQNEYFNFSHSY